jgi:hypothetical protein
MKKILFFILAGFIDLHLWAQSDTIDSLLADILQDDEETASGLDKMPALHFLYMGTVLNSRTFYAGREIGENMVNLNGSIFYFNSRGFFIGASGAWYSQLDPGYNSTIASFGIIKSTGNKTKVTFRTTLSRYFYYQPNPDLDYSLKNNLGTGLTIKNKCIGGRVTMNLMFGEDIGINASSVLFSSITILKFGKFNKIILEPELSIFMGSETIEYDYISGVDGKLTDTQTPTSTKETYGLLNAQFYFPVSLSLNNWEVELSYSVNKPFTKETSITYPVTSNIAVTLGYLLPLN